MTRILSILIAVVLVILTSVVCFIIRKPIGKYASKVWNWIARRGSDVSRGYRAGRAKIGTVVPTRKPKVIVKW